MRRMRELLKVQEVAANFGVAEQTVRRWIKSGKLAYVLTPGGQIRVPADSFQLRWETVVADEEELL